jgi:chromosomal replication initiation ATPase DnaA
MGRGGDKGVRLGQPHAIVVYTPLMPERSFSDIGFLCNPFRAMTREEWIRAAIIPETVRRAITAGGHIQLLGDAGSGKTSSLLALGDQFHKAGMRSGYEYLPRKEKSYRTKTDGLEIFLLDEAQRLSKGGFLSSNEMVRLLDAAKNGVRLILGTHEDLSPAFRSRRISPVTVTLSTPAAEELAGILERRLDLFSLKPIHTKFSPEAVDWLRSEVGANLRTMEYFLYDYFQAERPEGIIAAGPLQKSLVSFTPPVVEEE